MIKSNQIYCCGVVVILHTPTYVSSYHGYSGYNHETSCAAGFRKSAAALVCAKEEEFSNYGSAAVHDVKSTCCLPTDPASVTYEVAVALLVATHIWAEVAQQYRIARRVEYENLGQWVKDTLARYTQDIWNILDTAALFIAALAGIARAFLFAGVGILSPLVTADLHMIAIILGFLRIMTVLQVFEFSGSQFFFILCYYYSGNGCTVVSSKPN
jgi:hypothetical protein